MEDKAKKKQKQQQAGSELNMDMHDVINEKSPCIQI